MIAIRGTFHIRDALTDLVAIYEPFLGGHAHCGILRTAKKKLDSLRDHLVAAMEKYPDYGVVVVGHRLETSSRFLPCSISEAFLPQQFRCRNSCITYFINS